MLVHNKPGPNEVLETCSCRASDPKRALDAISLRQSTLNRAIQCTPFSPVEVCGDAQDCPRAGTMPNDNAMKMRNAQTEESLLGGLAKSGSAFLKSLQQNATYCASERMQQL